MLRSAAASSNLSDAFLRGLAAAGFKENRNVAIAYASADGQVERLKGMAAELVSRRVAAIFAASSNAALAAKEATSSIPIVYVGASDPVKLGLAQSLARPGGNVTGFTMYSHTFSAKRLELLHELVPQAKEVGVLINPANPSAAQETQDLRQAAATLGLEASFVEVRSEGEFDAAMARLSASKILALYIVDDPLFAILEERITVGSLKASIAVISTLRSFAERGALASYGADFARLYRDAGTYIGRILKGEKPADLPITLPTKFSLAVNMKTAHALGLALAPGVLARADEVIE